MEELHTKLLIIGSGPSGYTAALYAARANLNPILVRGIQPGGQLTITTDVENYPGFADIIQGPWLMEQMYKQVKKIGATIIEDNISQVDFLNKPFKAIGSSKKIYYTDSVIICTGSQAKWLNLPSEEEFKGFGVSGCATCDGFFYKNKKVVVVGGGNTAVEEALYLAGIASEVLLIHRKESLRAEMILQDRLFKNHKIKIKWNTVIERIIGNENPKSVTGVIVKDIQSNTSSTIKADGVFIAIGHSPSTEMFKNQLDLDQYGFITTKPDSTSTNIEGVFAAGDVQDSVFRQAITAAGTGCMAALEAERWLNKVNK